MLARSLVAVALALSIALPAHAQLFGGDDEARKAILQIREQIKVLQQRETEIARIFGAVFIIGIGAALSNGEPHDGRAPDYDDWSSLNDDGYFGLNGDIILWNPVLESAFEVSSMGIRVDRDALLKQLEIDYIKRLKGKIPDNLLPLYSEKGTFDVEFRVGEDILLFSMHSNVFEFDNNHPMNKIPYVLEDPLRSYCGMIMIYNFLADSFNYRRINDLGYMVGRFVDLF